ncbi:type VI secretion system baseplate subunit TssK [Rugamonas sp. DEMB1]|nr:type VI secretion system baseplate subunit TssK [Rugamonas sp. DEMB1]
MAWACVGSSVEGLGEKRSDVLRIDWTANHLLGERDAIAIKGALWTEGLPLAPQQFQQTDRYHEARLQRIASAINPHLWGVRALSVNEDQLSNNVLSINTMSLIFQDGDIVEAPPPTNCQAKSISVNCPRASKPLRFSPPCRS